MANASIEMWLDRLRQLGSDIASAPPPDRRPPARYSGMTAQALARADEKQRLTTDRITRLNLLFSMYADFLIEQPAIARKAGVSDTTLADSRCGFRWSK